jgi:hypothetical protein
LIFQSLTVYNNLRLYTNLSVFKNIFLKEVDPLQDGTLWKVRGDCSTVHFEPPSDLPPPDHHPFVVAGITSFKVFQQPLYLFAPGGKDGKADHDKEKALKKRKEETKDPQSNEEPPED